MEYLKCNNCQKKIEACQHITANVTAVYKEKESLAAENRDMREHIKNLTKRLIESYRQQEITIASIQAELAQLIESEEHQYGTSPPSIL